MLANDSNELCDNMFFVLLMTSQLSRRAALPFFNPDTRTFDVWSTGSVEGKWKHSVHSNPSGGKEGYLPGLEMRFATAYDGLPRISSDEV